MSIALNNSAASPAPEKENPMGKLNDSNHLHGQRTTRSLLAITLAASLAAFGCTTNHNLGNGTPTRSGPEVRTAPTSGVTSGGETATPPSNPPMTSSYNRSEVLPTVTPRSIRRSADEAAAILAGNQAPRGRYLGVVSPGTPGRGYESNNIQTFVPPALQTNPQQTINATISSNPTPAINSGADGAAIDAGGVVTAGAVTAGAVITNDVSPTAAGTGLAVGTFAGTSTLPTFASANVPSVTAASVGAGRTLNGGFGIRNGVATTGTTAAATTTTGATTTTTTPTTAAATSGAATAATGTRSGSIAAPVRILRGSTGVTVTNVNTATSTATPSGRSQ
jgi:hypothetical protein